MFKVPSAKSLLAYTLPILFIGCWWWMAFYSSYQEESLTSFDYSPKKIIHKAPPLSRKELHKALLGDFDLMIKLITEWDIEAELLEKEHEIPFKRLPRDLFLKAHSLKKLIPTQNISQRKFLPQSYAAATILLSLVPPEEIVAIPGGLRLQEQLFAKELTDRIHYTTDQYSSERLYLMHPDIAFVAPYSNPLTIQSLKNQKIPTVSLPCPRSLDEISPSIRELGNTCGNPYEGDLLALFYEASICAIDNRIALLEPSKVLYMTHHTHFTIPTEQSLIGQLIAKVHWNQGLTNGQSEKWRVPIDRETIHRYNPDCIILSTMEDIEYSEKMFIVDESIQESPTHYLALAYFDLYEALEKAQQ